MPFDRSIVSSYPIPLSVYVRKSKKYNKPDKPSTWNFIKTKDSVELLRNKIALGQSSRVLEGAEKPEDVELNGITKERIESQPERATTPPKEDKTEKHLSQEGLNVSKDVEESVAQVKGSYSTEIVPESSIIPPEEKQSVYGPFLPALPSSPPPSIPTTTFSETMRKKMDDAIAKLQACIDAETKPRSSLESYVSNEEPSTPVILDVRSAIDSEAERLSAPDRVVSDNTVTLLKKRPGTQGSDETIVARSSGELKFPRTPLFRIIAQPFINVKEKLFGMKKK